jgi:superfamily II DNA or RNA helicase
LAKIQIQIRDEVNCKIIGLDLSDRKKLVDRFKYEIPGARYQPSVRLGRWDGKVPFCSLAGSTYINLLPEVIPILDSAGYEIELFDHRTYETQFSFAKISADSFSDKVWPKGHIMAGQPIVLRDYQIELINCFLENTQCVQEVATGAGKTIVTAVLSKSIEQYGRSIIIVPSKGLVEQTEEDYHNLGLDVGVYFGDRKEYNHTHTICTWQSLNILLKNTRSAEADVTIGEFLDNVVCIMVDEVHSAKADALKTLLTGVMSHIPIRWGLTGTVPKEDYARISILCSIGPIMGTLAASTLQEAGHLANCHINVVQLVDYVEFKTYQEELKYLTSTPGRIDYLANLLNTVKDSGNTLILVDRIETGKMLQARLSNLFSLIAGQPDAVFISGITKVNARKEEYNEIATSDNNVIIATYGVAAIGINIPRIFNLVLVEPGKSFVRVIQSIGRGIRKADDKDFVQVWDITSTCKFSKRHLTKRKQFYREAKYEFAVEKVEWQ